MGMVMAFPAFLEIIGFYVVDDPIESRNLLIEGWLDTETLENAPFDFADYDSIFVVGLRTKSQFYKVKKARMDNYIERAYHRNWMLTNGYLFLKDYERVKNDSVKAIRLVAQGSPANGVNAHFFLMVKDSVIGNSSVKEDPDTIEFKVNLKREQLEYLNVYFNNDFSLGEEDINLAVQEMFLDSFRYQAKNDDFLFMKLPDNEIFNSNAKKTAALISINLKKDTKLFVVDTLFRKRNKTLAAACSFQNFIEKNNMKISSLNIYTLDYHSRRTKLSYKKALDSDIKIGMYIKQTQNSFPPLKPRKFLSWYLVSIGHFASWFGTLLSFR